MEILILNILLIIGSVFGSDKIPETIVRRTENVLESIYKTNIFTYELLDENEFSGLYKLNADSNFVAYLVYTSSKGRFERFQYMILYSPDVEVIKVKILQYNSTRGTEVTSKKWLRQFEGNKGDKLVYGKDIQAITGATYSANSITEDVPAVTQWVKGILKR